jgi:hypothetical protein
VDGHKLQPVVIAFSQFIPKIEQFAHQHLPLKETIVTIDTRHIKIHSCLSHCVLYCKGHNKEVRCPTCNASRYKMKYDKTDDGSMDNRKKRGWKKKNISDKGEEEVNERKFPALMMWYLPVIDHLKHLFSNSRDAKFMIWHVVTDGRNKDRKFQHPVGIRQWKTFDLNNPEFSHDLENVRRALSTDGMNPFGEMMNPHNT